MRLGEKFFADLIDLSIPELLKDSWKRDIPKLITYLKKTDKEMKSFRVF